MKIWTKRILMAGSILVALFCLFIGIHAVEVEGSGPNPDEGKLTQEANIPLIKLEPRIIKDKNKLIGKDINQKNLTPNKLQTQNAAKMKQGQFQSIKSQRNILTGIKPTSIVEQGKPVIEQLLSPSRSSASKKKVEPNYREGEVLVKFKKGVTDQTINTILSSKKLPMAKIFKKLSQIKKQPYALIRAEKGKAEKGKAEKMIALLLKDPRVAAASLNYIHQTATVDSCSGNIPNDTFFGYQWALCNEGQTGGTPDADIDATEAWGIQSGAPGVVVAVLDTGVDYTHPDLAGNMWINSGEIPGNHFDDDGNGYVDDVYGIDTGSGDSDPMPGAGHGTHVAGIIAAKGNNGLGVTGINWNLKIMAVKGFPNEGDMSLDAELEALEYIIDMKQRGVNIVAINASYGHLGYPSDFEKEAIEAAGTVGIVFVAAAANDSNDNDGGMHNYPSDYDCANIVSVAASTMNDELAYFSNYGATSVDLAAPGAYILNTYDWWNYVPMVGDLFFDNMESGNGKWSISPDSPWEITSEQSYSPSKSWSDSPGGDYADNAFSVIESKPINLNGVTGNKCFSFLARYDLEAHYDWLDVYFQQKAEGYDWQRTEEKASSGSHSWSDSPGGDYHDNSNSWLVSPVIDLSSANTSCGGWGLTTEKAYSGSHAWSDSPSGNYLDNTENWLVSPLINLSGASSGNGMLYFKLTGVVETGYDYLEVYVSPDNGATWKSLGTVTGNLTLGWYQLGPEIPAEYLTSQLRVAFVLSSDVSFTYDGYYVDDVVVTDHAGTPFFSDTMESGENGWERHQDFSNAKGRLDFNLTGVVEDGWDFLEVYFSPDDGETWNYQGYITGDWSDQWYQIWGEIPTEYLTSKFRVAFVLFSDEYLTYDGYYIDDVAITDACGTQLFFDNMESGENGWERYQRGYYKNVASITGTTNDGWRLYTIPVNEEFYWENFQVAFVLSSDASITSDGVYLDNIGIGDGTLIQGYAFLNGTSMAASHVTGAVGLVASQYPLSTSDERIHRILDHVDPLPSLAGKVATGGRLNLLHSLITPGDIDRDGNIDQNDVNIILSHRNQPASVCPECDLDGDGRITVFDARLLMLSCTCPKCICPI